MIYALLADKSESVETVRGIENIQGADGVSIAIAGLLIVFTGLILISLFIAFLPKLVEKLNQWIPVTEHHAPANGSNGASATQNNALSNEAVAAIGYAMHNRK